MQKKENTNQEHNEKANSIRALSPLSEHRERSCTISHTIDDIGLFSPCIKPKKSQIQPSPFYLFRCNRSKIRGNGREALSNDLSIDDRDDLLSQFIVNECGEMDNMLFQRRDMSMIRTRALSVNSIKDDQDVLKFTCFNNKLLKQFDFYKAYTKRTLNYGIFGDKRTLQ